MHGEQELSYRKQIARQLRTQYVEGINRPKYYNLTLKCGLEVTQGHWKWYHLKALVRFPIRLLWRYLVSLKRYSDLLVENRKIFDTPPVVIGPQGLRRRNFAKMFDANKTRMLVLLRGEETMTIR